MSARVFNPTVLSELYKLRSPAVTRRHIPNVAAIAKIKRDLFGPVDRDQAKRLVFLYFHLRFLLESSLLFHKKCNK